jgi:hypothetical protein
VSARTLRALLGALLVLLSVWAIVTLLAGRRDPRRGAPPALTGFFHAATEANVSAVRLKGPRDTVTLERHDGVWSANGYRADSKAVARFWKALKDARVGDVVATNPSNHRRMGVTSDSMWRVDLDTHDGVRSILVGKTGPRSGTTYVRLPEEDTVYLLEGDLRIRVAYTTDDWRDRRILGVDTSAVARIAVELDRQRYTIARGKNGWNVPGDGTADTTTVRIILTELTYLHAAGFLEKADTIAEKPYGGVVTAFSASGDTLAQLTLGAGPGDRWARTRGDSTLYRLAY